MSDYQTGLIEKYNDKPIKIVNETKKVHPTYYFITLEQTPNEFHRVKIDEMNEVFDIEDITENSYKVDYSSGSGKVFFHPSKAGQNITINEYWGLGVVLLSSDRIVTQVGTYGEAISTMTSDIEIINQMKDDYYTGTHFQVVTSQASTYIATNDGVGSFQIPVGIWNPLIDVLFLMYEGLTLILNEHYIIEGGQITLQGWTLNQGEEIVFYVEKGTNSVVPSGSDGSLLMNQSVTQQKLSQDIQDKLNEMEKFQIVSSTQPSGHVVGRVWIQTL